MTQRHAHAYRRSCGTFVLLLTSLAWVASEARAQGSLSFIHKFHSGPRYPYGRLVETPDGALYGTTTCGGEPDSGCRGGTIFALRLQDDGTRRLETVLSFRPGLHGGAPFGGLTLGNDGSLYGITTWGGRPLTESAIGTVFRFELANRVLTRLHVFANSQPVWRLTQGPDGNFYGATCYSSNFQSTIFQVTPSGAFTTVHALPISTNPQVGIDPSLGYCPIADLQQAPDGYLYGTAIAGGPSLPQYPQFPPSGTVFRIGAGGPGSSYEVVHTFRRADGAQPMGGLTLATSGDLFGTTMLGGLYGHGVVYRVDGTRRVRHVHMFSGADGSFPFGGLFRTGDGSLLGATMGGGLGYGTIFRVGAGGFSSVHQFTGADGQWPSEVMRASDGRFYGVTVGGGPGSGGTIFSFDTPTGAGFKTLHTFAGGPRVPASAVIEASDGFLYGTTTAGDLEGGTVFRMTKSGELTVLHTFAPIRVPGGANSIHPASLIEGADGNLYGTTLYGGEHRLGSIFRMTKEGALTPLHSFDKDYALFLLQASDGIYGSTRGNSAAAPTVFRVEPAGGVRIIHDASLGSGISVPLAEGADGALYFTDGFRGLFRLTKDGGLTLEHSFNSSSDSSDVGWAPRHGLIRGSDGALYGTTSEGGPAVFRFDPATKQVTVVARLHGSELTEGRDDALYTWGWARPGAETQTLFRVTKAGGVTAVHAATHEDGRSFSRVVHGSDGALYGTVTNGPWRPFEPETWTTDTFAGGVLRVSLPLVR